MWAPSAAVMGIVLLLGSSSAGAADFVQICEVNQAIDTGLPTSAVSAAVCRCIERGYDAHGKAAAMAVFQKVLAARGRGQGLHPSQVTLEEMAALMAFADRLKACNVSPDAPGS